MRTITSIDKKTRGDLATLEATWRRLRKDTHFLGVQLPAKPDEPGPMHPLSGPRNQTAVGVKTKAVSHRCAAAHTQTFKTLPTRTRPALWPSNGRPDHQQYEAPVGRSRGRTLRLAPQWPIPAYEKTLVMLCIVCSIAFVGTSTMEDARVAIDGSITYCWAIARRRKPKKP